MTGFKNFLLRGNLIELAVAFIMGAAFATVVTAFTTWVTSLLPGGAAIFDKDTELGTFLNALVAFVLLAAVVYFLIVLPYTKAKERYFPSQEPGEPADVALLTEIRDILRAQGESGTTPPRTGG
jgi:large conductance mechanosensitive channel